MEKNGFTEKTKTSARRIDEAGIAASRAVGTEDFLPAYSRLLEVFKKEYTVYLYAEARIDPFDPAVYEEDYKNAKKLEEITARFAAGLEILTVDFVLRYDPLRATKELGFFEFLRWNADQRAASQTERESVSDYRRGISGMTKREERLLSAALKRLSSVTDITAEKLGEVAEALGCDYETLCAVMLQNNASAAESLDSLYEDGEGETVSLYDRVADRDPSEELKLRAEEVEQKLSLIDELLSYSRPEGMKKKEAPPYELSKTEKERYPIIFTNSLILGWVDLLRDSDPDCKNREDVFRHCFERLALQRRLEIYRDHLAVSREVFELYMTHRREFTAKELGAHFGFDSTSLPGIALSVSEKLRLFIKK